MDTACKCCEAPIVRRHWLVGGHAVGSAPGEPLFVEVYECGGVYLWGRIEGDGVARTCPKKQETDDANE
jgi:hypothetical protein